MAKILNFPLDLDIENQPFLRLVAYSWKFRGKTELDPKANKEIDSEGTFFLQAPDAGTQEQISHAWDMAENLSGSIAGAVGKTLTNELFASAKGFVQGAANWGQRTAGVLSNDFAGLFYGGVDFRTFNFPFTFIPKSEDEAQRIFDIYYQMKRLSTPDYEGSLNLAKKEIEIAGTNVDFSQINTGGFLVNYPNFWKIEMHSGRMGILFQTLECALVDITINYSPDGINKIFESGVPIKMQMNLSFKELQRYSRHNIKPQLVGGKS